MKWIERQRYFIDFTLSSLWRRKSKNLALLLVYTMIVFVVASVVFFTNALRQEAASLLSASPQMTVQRTLAGRYDIIPLSYIDQFRGIRGVESVKPRLWGYYYHPVSRANYTVMVSERFPCGDDEAIIGHGVEESLETGKGEHIYFKGCDGAVTILQVKQVFSEADDLLTADLVLMSEATFRRIFGVPEGYATDLVIGVRNPRESGTIATKIVKVQPRARPILREDILRTYSSIFDWRSGYTMVLLSGAVLAFFIFAWEKATGLGAEERSEIGILKAVGWETSDILLMKFWEGMVISLTAFLVGVSLAYVHVFLSSAPLFEHALKGWSVLYPKFRLTPAVDGFQLVVLFALVVLPYTCITIVPAWKVAITSPDTVMR